MQRCCFPPALFCIHSWRSTGGRQQLARCPPPPGGALALASFYTGSDHHLTTPSSQLVPCAVCTSQHSFITTTNSAGSCAHYTISGAGSCYLPVRHSSPTTVTRWHGLLIFGDVPFENSVPRHFSRWSDHELTTMYFSLQAFTKFYTMDLVPATIFIDVRL